MPKQTDREIQRLKKALMRDLAWGEVSTWHSKMFDELSEKIFAKTSVMLSAATLKRFFGVVRHDGAPSTTTLDALSRYLGSENWTAFKTHGVAKRRRWEAEISRRSIYISAGFLLAVIVVALLSSRRPEVVIASSEFSFSSRVLSREYPNSVVFDFSIPQEVGTDSLYIQQYWDPSRTIQITADQTHATGIYYFPGYFKAQLWVEDQSVRSHDLFLKSDGWLGTIDYEPVPKYFRPTPGDGTFLQCPKEIIEEVQSSTKPVITTYHYVDDMGDVSADDFTVSASVSNTFHDLWAVCQSMQIFLVATDGAMIIPFSKLGCSSDNMLMLNDRLLSGKEHDLSAFSADFAQAKLLTIVVKDMEVVTFIEDQEVSRFSYGRPMGQLVGVRFKFRGLGEVQGLTLTDRFGEEVHM